MKRTNRLILLVGLFLAVVAFVGIYLLLTGNGGGGGPTNQNPDQLPTVYATKDIALGVQVQADMVEQKDTAVTERAADAFNSTTLVIGQIARTNIVSGQQLTAANFAATAGVTSITCPIQQRCISVQVDQVSGVGTLIQTGDYVDMLVGFGCQGCNGQFPIVTVNPNDNTLTPVTGVNQTSVKLLLQGLQVVGVLLPPPPADNGNNNTGTTPETNLNGQSEIVILSVTAQQSEVIKFAQLDGNISLVLRAFKDFADPNNPGIPVTPVPDVTTGIILKTLVDEYGVLVPQVVEGILPTQTGR